MEYRNNLGIMNSVKSIAAIVIGTLILFAILNFMFILIPFAVLAWFGYKGIKKFINKSHKTSFKKRKDDFQANEVFFNDVDDINVNDAIDTDYEEIKR